MARSIASKNLDVARTSRDSKIANTKGVQGELASAPYLSSLCAGAARPNQQQGLPRRHYRVGGTRYITLPQATNIIKAVTFAKSICLPLVAHLTIHWAYTDAGDDPDGKRFAKVREGLAKWLRRHGIVLAAVWCIERMSRGQAEVVHCHLLFHLPIEYRSGARLLQLEAAIYRLIKRHGRDYWADEVIKLLIHDKLPYPDGKYLIKGGGPKVWKLFRLRRDHRRLQGIIHGKRCGTTENIGRAARLQPIRAVLKCIGQGT
jgi:hypothetical protein